LDDKKANIGIKGAVKKKREGMDEKKRGYGKDEW